MDINKTRSKILEEESTLGIYVWEMPDGRWIGDDDGNFLSVTSKKGNRTNIDALAREVSTFGIYEGGPKFLSARRKINDEEFQHPFDIGNYKDEMKKLKGLR